MKQKLETPCEERDRLAAAHQDAVRDGLEFAANLSAQIQSDDQNARRQARKQIERAELHQHHLLDELSKHEKNHGCG